MTPDFRFALLKPQQMPQAHLTFQKAFADYLFPIQFNEEQFRDKRQREGIEPGFCVGAFVGEEMVAFILTGVGEWQGKPTAYNAGTGVLPAYRGYGLTGRMYAFLLPKLRESGVELCLLEVIRENEPALHAYKRVGFATTRTFDCLRGIKNELLLAASLPEGVEIKAAARPNYKLYRCLREVEPSWQNNDLALKRSGASCSYVEALNEKQELVGYLAFFPKSGAVAQLAVDAHWRGRGIGTALLRATAAQTTAPSLLFINIEHTATGLLQFLERRYFKPLLQQYEMELALA